jgi:hypothetical protein
LILERETELTQLRDESILREASARPAVAPSALTLHKQAISKAFLFTVNAPFFISLFFGAFL